MKDSTQNNANASDKNDGKGWDDPAFGWDNMQQGIFEKIVEEDPDFFKEKRMRRVPFWFWFCAAMLVGGGVFLYFQNGSKVTPKAPKPHSTLNENIASVQPNIVENTGIATPKSNSEATESIASNTISNDEKTSANNQSNRKSTTAKPLNSTAVKSSAPALFVDEKSAAIVRNDDQIAIEKERQSPQTLTLSITPLTHLSVLDIHPFLFPLAAPIIEPQPKTPSTEPSETPKPKGQWSLSATGGGLLSNTKYTGSSAAVALRNEHTSPWFGYQYGMALNAPFCPKARLFIGVNRQVAYQNIDIYTERMVRHAQKNALLAIKHNVVAGNSTNSYGDTTVNAIEKNRLVHYNEQKSVQSQVGFAWQITSKRWHFSPFAGCAVGYLTSMEGFTVAADKSIFGFGKAAPILRKFKFLPLAGFNVERDLGKALALTMNYQFQRQINNASKEIGMSYKPVTSFVSLGISMKMDKR